MNLTPAMQQYYDLKEQNSDAILFFRMWDFYEMFDDDAIIANKVLWIAVTARNKNSATPTPLAWIPFHAKEKYLPLLIEAWYKVAIAEQVSDPNLKWIVKREIVRVITPSTIWLESDSYENSNSTIISIIWNDNWYWLSVLNIQENDWKTCEFKNIDILIEELYKLNPREVILDKNLFNNNLLKSTLEKKYWLNIYYFNSSIDPYKKLLNHFWVSNLEWFWIQKLKNAQKASWLLIDYIETNQKNKLSFIKTIGLLNYDNTLKIDESTIRNLDLIYNFATKSNKEWTLFWILSKTKTNSWSYLLMDSILNPLNNINEINKRLDFIDELIKNKNLLDKIRDKLTGISNINWILNRLSLNRSTPRDLINLNNSLILIVEIIELIKNSWNKKLLNILKK